MIEAGCSPLAKKGPLIASLCWLAHLTLVWCNSCRMFTRISQLSSPSVLSQCICLNWLALRNSLHVAHTGVCEKVNPFVQALALQSSSRSCSLAPDLVLREPIFQMAVFSGGVFFSQTPLCFISVLGCRHRVASRIRAVWTRELNSVRIGYLSNGA